MATLYTDIANSQNSSLNNAANRPSAINLQGNLHVIDALYTMSGSEAANDIIKLADIPSGAVFMPGLSRVVGQSPGTTFSGHVGHADDDDAYGQTLALGGLAATGKNMADVTTAGAETLTPVVSGSRKTLQLKVTAVASLTANAKLRFQLVFRKLT